jgi:hypothetical protein
MLGATTTRETTMTSAWFIRFGWLYRPTHLGGWLVTLAALAYMIQVFIAIDLRAHSVTDLLYATYPHWGVTFLGWEWIARRTAASDTR